MPVSRVDGTGKRILVIDDDLAIRVLLQAVLKRMHFAVELAEDGAVGLEKLQGDGPVDLVLLDLMMPRLNGYEFIQRVTSVPVKRPHIIVFTAAGKRPAHPPLPRRRKTRRQKAPRRLDLRLDPQAVRSGEVHRFDRGVSRSW